MADNREITHEWCRCCEGKQAFSSCYFYGMFMEFEAEDETLLAEIFKYFPNSEALISRMTNFLNAKEKITETSALFGTNLEQIQNLIAADIKEKSRAIDQVYSLNFSGKTDRLRPKYVDDLCDALQSYNRNFDVEFLGYVSEIFSDSWIADDEKFFELKEAAYGVSQSNGLVQYLLQPLSTSQINLGNYFMIFALGGDYFVTQNELIFGKQISF